MTAQDPQSGAPEQGGAPEMAEISPADVARWQRRGGQPLLVDVREPWELEICAIQGSLSLPMSQILADPVGALAQLPCDRDLVIVCHAGVRSARIAAFLDSRGFAGVRNLVGGVEAWAIEVDPGMARY